jgi:tripartite-type tricarboxylate transporter receptor subunit TctC
MAMSKWTDDPIDPIARLGAADKACLSEQWLEVQMSPHRRAFLCSAAAALMAGLHTRASAQPLEIVRIHVGFPAGTPPDIWARKIGEKLVQSAYAKTIIVENRAGAGGQLGVVAVKGAPADGTHILLTPMSMLGVYPFTYKKLPYDPINDLTPVSMGISSDIAIAVGPMVPESVKDIAGLMSWFKANPEKANIASPGSGSTLHFTAITLGRAAGVELTHVGYKGAPPALQDMVGGSLAALAATLSSFRALMGPNSKIRLLATSGARRSPFTPNVPTLAEQGFKDMVCNEWAGFYLPAKAPAAVVSRLNLALHHALKSPDIVEFLSDSGVEATPKHPGRTGRCAAARDEAVGSDRESHRLHR